MVHGRALTLFEGIIFAAFLFKKNMIKAAVYSVPELLVVVHCEFLLKIIDSITLQYHI